MIFVMNIFWLRFEIEITCGFGRKKERLFLYSDSAHDMTMCF